MKRNRPFLFCLLALWLMAQGMAAQCDQTGQVINTTNNPVCHKLILSYETWELLVPTNPSLIDGIPAGTDVSFSFFPDTNQTPACNIGPAVWLECVALTMGPTSGCSAHFNHVVVEMGPAPTVSFQAVFVEPTANYLWDFGDGTTSGEATTTHVFPAQGVYDVCLTIGATACGGSDQYCQTIDLSECRAAFSYLADNGTVTFTNLSSGDFSAWKWNLGDGNEFYNTHLDAYHYGEISIYTVCLTVWNGSGCQSTFCEYVFSGTGDICDFASCVYPGDTNADGIANVYDLLPIGVGYGTQGPPRQLHNVGFALDWTPQYAPDWGVATINGNDYKHLDCNGDGQVDGDDLGGIEANYAPPGNIFMVQAPGAPSFWLEFEWDTILIDDNTPALIQLEADLMAGSPALPIETLNGFALQLRYPEDMVVEGGITVDYNDNSFLGHSNHLLWMDHDRHPEGTLDLAFTRKQSEKSGFGKIATLSFIIIGDVIARAEEAAFTVKLENAVAVNQEGAMLAIGQPDPATVIVVDKTTTDAHESQLDQQVRVFPNPASAIVNLVSDGPQILSVSIHNTLGQLVQELPGPIANHRHFSVAGWESGIYLLKINTDRGVAVRRVLVH